MITDKSANFRVSVLFPVRNTGKAIKILDRHLKLGFGQRLELTKSKTPYTMPHDYTLEYATLLAQEFEKSGTAVRVFSSVDGDVTGDIIGRKENAPTKAPPSAGAKLVAGLIVAGIVFWVFKAIIPSSSDKKAANGATAGSTATAPVPAKPIAVTASQLFAAYQRNEIQADNSFKGRKLLVTGSIQSINKDFKDDPYIVLSTANMFMGVHVNLADGEANAASTLARGERISALCDGAGMVVGSPMLENCHLQ